MSLKSISCVHHGLKLADEFNSSVNYTFISLRIEDHRIIEISMTLIRTVRSAMSTYAPRSIPSVVAT